eukprot:71769-Amphidinium_carterae.2
MLKKCTEIYKIWKKWVNRFRGFWGPDEFFLSDTIARPSLARQAGMSFTSSQDSRRKNHQQYQVQQCESMDSVWDAVCGYQNRPHFVQTPMVSDVCVPTRAG